MQINNTTNVCSSFLVNSLKRVHVVVSVLSVLFPCLSSWFCFLYASIALFCCFCMSFLSFSLTLLYSSLTHWLAHCYYLYFSKCSSPPFLSLSRPPPFTLSTLSEGAILINASALKVTTCIQLQGLFLSWVIFALASFLTKEPITILFQLCATCLLGPKIYSTQVCKRECLVNASQGRSPLVNT